jgi:hypothetical protein
MNEPHEFDGAREKLGPIRERGQSYGLSGTTYWHLANASMAAKEYGGIEPCQIQKLKGGRPGATVVLFGKAFAFILTVAADTQPASVTLEAMQLDSASEQRSLVLSVLDCPGDWTRLITAMLQLDGLRPDYKWVSYEQATLQMWAEGLDV